MSFRKTLVLTAVVFALLSAPASAELMLQLKAADYNPTTGVWTDSSGKDNNATVYGAGASLVAGMTPNGSSAVYLSGSGSDFGLATGISGSNFTMFAYLMPDASSSGYIVGGGLGSPGYTVSEPSSQVQRLVRAGQLGVGMSDTPLSPTAFNMIDVRTQNSAAGTQFRLNQSDDGGSSTPNGFSSSPITRIGSLNAGWAGNPHNYLFAGYIAEIRIYNDATVDRVAVESEMLATYVPEPSMLALLATGLIGLLCYAWRKRR